MNPSAHAHAARIAPFMCAAGVPAFTVGFGMYEDSGDAWVRVPPPGAPPGAASLADWVGADDVAELGLEGCYNQNEGSTGEVHVNFAKGTVRAETYHCTYLSSPDDAAEDDDLPRAEREYDELPLGAHLPKYATERWGYGHDRYYAPETQVAGPDEVQAEFDPEGRAFDLFPSGEVDGLDELIAGGAPGPVMADYLEETDRRAGPAYPALARFLRVAAEPTAAEFEQLPRTDNNALYYFSHCVQIKSLVRIGRGAWAWLEFAHLPAVRPDVSVEGVRMTIVLAARGGFRAFVAHHDALTFAEYEAVATEFHTYDPASVLSRPDGERPRRPFVREDELNTLNGRPVAEAQAVVCGWGWKVHVFTPDVQLPHDHEPDTVRLIATDVVHGVAAGSGSQVVPSAPKKQKRKETP